MTERLAYRVPEVCAMLGISRATLYRRVKTGEILVRKFGVISLISRESLELLLETLPASVPTILHEKHRDAALCPETRERPETQQAPKQVRRRAT